MNEKNFLEQQEAATRKNFDAALQQEAEAGRVELEAIATSPPSPQTGRSLPGVTGRQVRWHLSRGLIRLWDGDAGGWQDLSDVVFCQRWNARIQEAAYQRSTDPERVRIDVTSKIFSDALLATYLGDQETADVHMDRLVAQTREGRGWRNESGALTFQARLYERIAERSLNLSWERLPPMGRYEELLDDGLSGSSYSAALDRACQEHLSESKTRKGRLSAFTVGGYAQLPIELMCWLRYRRQKGLPHATEGHALLESPLATLEVPPPLPEPTSFRNLVERCLPHYHAYLSG